MERLLIEKDLSILQKTVNSFVKEQVETMEQSHKKYVTELSANDVSSLQEKARAAGLKALGAKRAWGGAGLSLLARTVIYEEASQHRLGLYHPAGDAFGEELPSFLEKCTQEQIETYVKPAVQQGTGCVIALWEEQEDNHIEKLTSTAVKNGDEWIINGQKSYLKKMEQSSFGVILVNCLGQEGEAKPTLFILEKDDPFEIKETMLIDVQNTHDLFFKDVRIKDIRRIGAVGEGAQLMKQWLTESQILLGARCLGISERALQYAKDYAKLRITRGKPLAEFPSIRTMIANGVMNLKAAKLMVQEAAKKVDNGEIDGAIDAKMAKLFAVDTAAKIIDDTFQIHGGTGFAGDLPIERWYKEIRLARLDLQKKETVLEEIARIHLY
ncbi:butyryl-CoA dehydrogenase [Neobacillus bataviensis LMG 21833]|uniref:Butyryl-CoA dehydrogenase n=1 Tax=Neobacillus bataviensis LMG 21833 TaxID=1117379 RepID=K6DTG9_9BACI|nr:acyl-CoA dehydrogenase family protein [Neobacillus bataviensis]EKN71669.1 butyryl-CoA dehydrogenase [Neobacillus bataviensis LMG 21833]